MRGTVLVNAGTVVREAQMVVLDRAGQSLFVEANSDAVMLFLSGEPIDEPIVGYSPLVMNSPQEIAQAMADFNSGRFGQMAHEFPSSRLQMAGDSPTGAYAPSNPE